MAAEKLDDDDDNDFGDKVIKLKEGLDENALTTLKKIRRDLFVPLLALRVFGFENEEEWAHNASSKVLEAAILLDKAIQEIGEEIA